MPATAASTEVGWKEENDAAAISQEERWNFMIMILLFELKRSVLI
jgi:hypothetical protein